MMRTRIAALARGGVAVMALLRRDLLAGGRAAPLRTARAAALVVSGGMVLTAYAATGPGYGGQAAIGATLGIFSMLTLIAALSAPQVAIQALRRERDAGMLDLLVMAGLAPGRLALGRILSTFVNLLSLLLATLPALALLAFFGRPTARELLACIGVEALAWLSLAAFAVAVSAWARSTASAAVLALLGLVAWAGLLAFAGAKGFVVAASGILIEVLGFGGMGVDPLQAIMYVSLHVGLGLLCWCLAAVGIRRRAPGAPALRGGRTARRPTAAPGAARRPAWLGRLAWKPPPLRAAWPLTWLLQRRSPVARPRMLALLLLIPPLVLTWKGEEGALITAWLLAILAMTTALLVPAFHVNVARERQQWETLMATAIEGRRAVLDLVRGALSTSVMPGAACLVAMLLVALHRMDAAGIARGAAACVALIATWVTAALLGTAAGLVARSTAGAVRLVAWLVLLVGGGPFLVYGCAIVLEERALDGISLIYVLGVAGLVVLSLALLAGVRARNGPAATLVAVPATWALAVAPLFMVGDFDTGPFFPAGGFAGLVALSWEVAAPGFLAFPPLPILLALPHAILALMLLASLTRRADRWLGRPG